MVFTHIPANVCLVLAALAPTLPLALGLLFVRSAAVADGRADPHRLRDGRRDAGRAHRGGELHGGAAQPGRRRRRPSPARGWRPAGSALPLVACGALKIAYDLTLLFAFRHVRLPDGE